MAAELHPAPQIVPPRVVIDIATRLESAGYETWCVGGAVRDALLGIPHLDWDFATAARPEQVRKLFRRTIPVGELHGTIGVLDEAGRLHEVTTFRRDVRTDGRHAEVEFGASLDDDLARRDFTINALAYSPSRKELRDPFGGRDDLARGIVRAVGNPVERMREDWLRALRGLRFAGRFGFSIDEATWTAIQGSAGSLHLLSKERIQQELVKVLEQIRTPSHSLTLWKRAGALAALLPALAAEPDWRLEAADRVALPDAHDDPGRKRRRTLVRLGALCAGLAPARVAELLRELRFANRDVSRLAKLVGVVEFLSRGLEEAEVRDAELRRWAAATGRLDLPDALRIAIAGLGAQGKRRTEWLAIYRRALRCALRDPVEISDLSIDGEDLISQAGVPPGPAIGATLRQLLEWVLEQPDRNRREVLLARARAMQTS